MNGASCLAIAVSLAAGSVVAAQEEQPAVPPAAAPRHTALPDQETIRTAVRDAVAERPDNPRLHEADTLRTNRYDTFARKFDEAAVPDCLHPDGLERQPPFFLSGIYALPFVAIAKLRGVCN
jgi:hypothetical protein